MSAARTLLKFGSPLLLVLLAEMAFSFGFWEPLANPSSHAGTSIRKKRALSDPAFRRTDFVTLGSSRPSYGIDHEALAARAFEQGLTYANLTMPGSHWMTIGVLTDWLAEHHPEIKGGIIAFSIQDFVYRGNGNYELGIVTPFRTLGEASELKRHVSFDWHDPNTYAIYSRLFAYREDIQDLVRHPLGRRRAIRYYNGLSAQSNLQENPTMETDMCSVGLQDMSACQRVVDSDDPEIKRLAGQCAQMQPGSGQRMDLAAQPRGTDLPEFMRATQLVVRDRLRAIHWQQRPIVVLMPSATIWKEHVSPAGLHQWVLEILEPLVKEGRIELIDGTDALDLADGSDCRTFGDFYHQNTFGREQFRRWLEPRLYPLLPAATNTVPDIN